MARTRSLQLPEKSGWYQLYWGGSPFGERYSVRGKVLEKVTIDTIDSPMSENPFDSQTREWQFGALTGTFGYWRYENCPPTSASRAHCTHLPIPAPYGINRKLAEMHPGAPAVNVPLALYELREVGFLAKSILKGWKKLETKHIGETGGSLSQGASNLWLTNSFMIQPMISDIVGLLGIADELDRRLRRLIKAQSTGLVRRQMSLGGGEVIGPITRDAFNAEGIGAYGDAQTKTSYKRWLSSKWRATTYFSHGSLTDTAAIRTMAAALGVDISFSAIYDAIPWSWFLEWVTDLPSLIKVYDNRHGYTFAGGSLMTTIISERTITPEAGSVWKQPTVEKLTSKLRQPQNPTLADVGFNILSANQLTTIAAIMHSSSGWSNSRRI